MSDSDLIDWEQLEMIFGDEDDFDEDMAELFQEFLEDGQERFGILKATSFETDRETLAKEAHKLKGSASNFGFIKVAAYLASIEDNIDTITAEGCEQALDLAINDFAKSEQAVVERYPAVKG